MKYLCLIVFINVFFMNISVADEQPVKKRSASYFDYLGSSVVGAALFGSPYGFGTMAIRRAILKKKGKVLEIDDLLYASGNTFSMGSSLGILLISPQNKEAFWITFFLNQGIIHSFSLKEKLMTNAYFYYALSIPIITAGIAWYTDKHYSQKQIFPETGFYPSFHLGKQSVYVNLAWQF